MDTILVRNFRTSYNTFMKKHVKNTGRLVNEDFIKLSCAISLNRKKLILTLQAPTLQNSKTKSSNSNCLLRKSGSFISKKNHAYFIITSVS